MNTAMTVLTLCLSLFTFTACQPAKTADSAQPPKPVAGISQQWAVKLDISGGFAGWHRSIDLDQSGQAIITDYKSRTTKTVTLGQQDLQSISSLMTDLSSDPGSTNALSSKCADCLQYILDYRKPSTEGQIRTTDRAIQDAQLRQLIQRLSSITNSSLRK